MGTHALVGVYTDAKKEHWQARYVHYDGYPDGVGNTIFKAYKTVFGKDAKKLAKFLMRHAWSTLAGCDLSLRPVALERKFKANNINPARPVYYRDETGSNDIFTDQDNTYCVFYAYIVDPNDSTISYYYYNGDCERLIFVKSYDLNSTFPDWE